MEPVVGCPSFQLDRIFKLRNKLLDGVFGDAYGLEPTGDVINQLCHNLRGSLPGNVEFHVLFESLRWLAGKMLTRELCFEVAWRFAGNIELLHAGRPVLPWTVQVRDEWVPVQVVRGVRTRDRFDHSGMDMFLRVLAGTPCPMVIRRFHTHPECERAALAIGFSRSSGHYPYEKSEQLVGLRFMALLDAAKSREQPWFKQIASSPSMLGFNRDILKMRFHITPCPNKWLHPCHQCAVGYETCRAATHRLNYVKQLCTQCNDAAAFFDMDVSTTICIACAYKNRMKR